MSYPWRGVASMTARIISSALPRFSSFSGWPIYCRTIYGPATPVSTNSFVDAADLGPPRGPLEVCKHPLAVRHILRGQGAAPLLLFERQRALRPRVLTR